MNSSRTLATCRRVVEPKQKLGVKHMNVAQNIRLASKAAITKSWKSIAEVRQQTNYENIIWQAGAANSKLEQSETEN